jgi:6-phosphofructokinase
MKRIAILTPGGDAPGENAAIWSATKTALEYGFFPLGVLWGFRGLVEQDFIEDPDLLQHLAWSRINSGGTVLRTARYRRFREDPSVRQTALANLQSRNLHHLVIIGGNGSLKGAVTLAKEAEQRGQPLHIAFVPATIDNDLGQTDYSIGFDSAVNVALEAIEKVRDHAESSGRMVIVQVMGAQHGQIALEVGLSARADAILIPEKANFQTAIREYEGQPWEEFLWQISCPLIARAHQFRQMRDGREAGVRAGSILVVAEAVAEKLEGGLKALAQQMEQNALLYWALLKGGENPDRLSYREAFARSRQIELSSSLPSVPEDLKDSVHHLHHSLPALSPPLIAEYLLDPLLEVRTVVLGHIQRGGSPTAFTRDLALRMGAVAISAFSQPLEKLTSVRMTALQNGEVKILEVKCLEDFLKKGVDESRYHLASLLAKTHRLDYPPSDQEKV